MTHQPPRSGEDLSQLSTPSTKRKKKEQKERETTTTTIVTHHAWVGHSRSSNWAIPGCQTQLVLLAMAVWLGRVWSLPPIMIVVSRLFVASLLLTTPNPPGISH